MGLKWRDVSEFSEALLYPGQGFWGEQPAALFFHSEIGQDLSHIGRLDPFLKLVVSNRKRFLADPVEDSWISRGALGNQGNSPRSEYSGSSTSCFPQPVFDIIQGFLRGEWPQAAADFNSLVEER